MIKVITFYFNLLFDAYFVLKVMLFDVYRRITRNVLWTEFSHFSEELSQKFYYETFTLHVMFAFVSKMKY